MKGLLTAVRTASMMSFSAVGISIDLVKVKV
jgi:hypothetical protein